MNESEVCCFTQISPFVLLRSRFSIIVVIQTERMFVRKHSNLFLEFGCRLNNPEVNKLVMQLWTIFCDRRWSTIKMKFSCGKFRFCWNGRGTTRGGKINLDTGAFTGVWFIFNKSYSFRLQHMGIISGGQKVVIELTLHTMTICKRNFFVGKINNRWILEKLRINNASRKAC